MATTPMHLRFTDLVAGEEYKVQLTGDLTNLRFGVDNIPLSVQGGVSSLSFSNQALSFVPTGDTLTVAIQYLIKGVIPGGLHIQGSRGRAGISIGFGFNTSVSIPGQSAIPHVS